MERRRKALGLRRVSPKKSNEIQAVVNMKDEGDTPKKSKSHAKLVQRKLEPSLATENKEVQSLSNLNVTPKNNFRKTRLFVQSPESPSTESPKLVGSPEVEVTWDYGCSQIPKEILVTQRLQQCKKPAPKTPRVQSPLVRNPRIIRSRQMSEEEQQKMMEYFKNNLVNTTQNKNQEHHSPDKNPNKDTNNSSQTTKDPITDYSKADKDYLSSLMDDSANEFMLECSQAIEEMLKKGDISGTVINIEIPNLKHARSPVCEPEKSNKKICFRKPKQNLFPDNCSDLAITEKSMNKNKLSVKSPKSQSTENSLSSKLTTHVLTTSSVPHKDFIKPKSDPNNQPVLKNSEIKYENHTSENHLTNTNTGNVKRNMQQIEINQYNASISRHPASKQKFPLNNNNSLNCNSSAQSKGVQNKGNNNAIYDSVDKFRKVPRYGQKTNQNPAPQISAKAASSSVISSGLSKHSVTGNEKSIRQQGIVTNINSVPETKPKEDNYLFMLDDGFDMALSSLDLDSLCSNAQEKVVPKTCTQEELEAKRQAALLRRKMKRKR